MNEVVEKEDIKIEDMIVEIRGVQVILAFDLAKLYNCTTGTKDINKAVKRNIEKFPRDFYFQLTKEEYYSILRFQIGTLELEQGKYSKYLPYAFTEQGISMLATVLHTNVAIEVSIKIMRTFVAMRHYFINNNDVYKSIYYINNKLLEHDDKFELLFSKFNKREQLFLQGEVYDAYSSFVSIFKEAESEIIIIDSYADIILLNLITKNSDRLNELEIDKYNSQYHNLKVFRDNSFHDRYFIIDKKDIYHSGTSINNAGNKTFSINKLEDDLIKSTLIENILKIIKQ